MDKPRISGYGLKYWAMFFMLCDHTAAFVIRRGVYGAFLSPEGYLGFSAAPAWLTVVSHSYDVLDVLGHAAFPLFVFLVSEGFLHTRSRKRYLLTLAAFAVLALYSGQRERQGWEYFFYAFYPAHFLVLLWIGKWIAAQSL